MKITLNFGVISIPYVNTDGKKPADVTTFQVAQFLENKYHVMQHFFELSREKIEKSLEDSLAATLESVLMGAPLNTAPFAAACSSAEASFKAFIENDVLASYGYPGVPTKAALTGVRNGKVTGIARASFFDTGLYKSSFKTWVSGYA